ncbi:hypothetical protein SELMODRAFT_420547 [Selaginella moellendorffii]|uniref:RING-type domain-containing protein n=1 Tax=Selaginella moellendorffii TaxID=88036 RepID=D8SCC5_SELML|nr:hypothetical protein SELMODRAFT_420547 [Selaginella moellendorffii]
MAFSRCNGAANTVCPPGLPPALFEEVKATLASLGYNSGNPVFHNSPRLFFNSASNNFPLAANVWQQQQQQDINNLSANSFQISSPQYPKVTVLGMGRSWLFDLGSPVDLILTTIRADLGNFKGRLVLEAVRDGFPPIKYVLGAKVTAMAEGWQLVVRCTVPKPYASYRISTLMDPKCSVCGEGPRTKALLPCHHLMCEECAVQMATIQKKCPICNVWIKSCTIITWVHSNHKIRKKLDLVLINTWLLFKKLCICILAIPFANKILLFLAIQAYYSLLVVVPREEVLVLKGICWMANWSSYWVAKPRILMHHQKLVMRFLKLQGEAVFSKGAIYEQT